MRKIILIPLALAAVGAATGTALAATPATAASDAQVTISAPFRHVAGERSPFDAAGIRAIRRGKPIPKGYVLVGRTVTIDRGTAGSSGAVTLLRCPPGKTARTLGMTGENGPNLVGYYRQGASYVGHKEVRIAVWSPPLKVRSTGVSYVVCR